MRPVVKKRIVILCVYREGTERCTVIGIVVRRLPRDRERLVFQKKDGMKRCLKGMTGWA